MRDHLIYQFLSRAKSERILPSRHDFVRSAALTMFVFGLLVWFYVTVIEVTHPDWLSDPLTHIDLPPFNWRVDETGMIAFAVAALGFFVWRLTGRRNT